MHNLQINNSSIFSYPKVTSELQAQREHLILLSLIRFYERSINMKK